MDDEIKKLIERINKNGMTITTPSPSTRKMGNKKGYIVFYNRRLKKSFIISKKKIKEL